MNGAHDEFVEIYTYDHLKSMQWWKNDRSEAKGSILFKSLAKSGIPSRSEITDAAMGERAECVMLNKGPYIVAAVRILGDILERMQAHHEKKNSLLRKLHLAAAFRAGT